MDQTVRMPAENLHKFACACGWEPHPNSILNLQPEHTESGKYTMECPSCETMIECFYKGTAPEDDSLKVSKTGAEKDLAQDPADISSESDWRLQRCLELVETIQIRLRYGNEQLGVLIPFARELARHMEYIEGTTGLGKSQF